MKILLIALPTLLGLCQCEKSTSSSYSILPYANEIQPLPSNYPELPSYYNYYDGNDEKKKFNFGRIMRAPFKALKGAGNYMMGMFGDVRSKFLELNGSFLRAKGDLMKAGGENIIRHAYKSSPKMNYNAAQTYYAPYRSQSGSKYNPNPKPIYPYEISEEEINQNAIDGLGLSDSGYGDVSNSIDFGYNDVQDDFTHDPEGFDDVNSEFSRRKNDFSVGNAKKFKNFTPSERDFSFRSFGRSRDFSVPNIDSRLPYPLTKHQQREFVQQRSAKDSETQRTQRSYHVVGGGYDFERPIPVPVPIAVNPSKLVFPSVQELNPIIGY